MTIVVVLLGLFLLVLGGYYYLCGFQAHGYKIKESLSVTKLALIDGISVLCVLIISFSFELSGYEKSDFLCLITLIPSFVGAIVKVVKYIGLRLIFTKRMTRLFSVYSALCLIFGVVAFLFESFLRVFGIVVSLAFVISYGALLITTPFENKNNQKYIQKAKDKLSKVAPRIIGITGSAGKTSVKEILKILLSPLGKVYATPKSYNTPLGITFAVDEMPDDTDIFLVEYGARNKGDIDCLLKIAKPEIGILTSITPQHLETFGSIQNIFGEKVKLLKASSRSFASEKCKWASNDFPQNTEFFGESCYLNKIFSTENTYLSLLINGKKITFTTSLLGSVNADNLVLAIGVALSLGVTCEQIVERISQIQAVPHRMQRVQTAGGVTVIDDSFNINPVGAISALDVLKTASGRKIVTCSGFVEQGTNDNQAIKTLCDKIVRTADSVIVLGRKNKKKLIENLNGKIEYHYAKDIEECKKLYSKILSRGDTLLILADIPMSYEL